MGWQRGEVGQQRRGLGEMDLRAAAKVGPDLLDEREELWFERAEREVM